MISLKKLERAVSARLRMGKWVAPNGILGVKLEHGVTGDEVVVYLERCASGGLRFDSEVDHQHHSELNRLSVYRCGAKARFGSAHIRRETQSRIRGRLELIVAFATTNINTTSSADFCI